MKLSVLYALFMSVALCNTSLLALADERYATKYATKDLLKLSMEQLMNVKVFSVSKREESYYNTAAAVFIISNDDIRRSGARNIPEALRLAPGVEVARVNANQYAVAIRGQNDLFSDKLLVLMDGRTLYTPTTSGVFWLVQNYPLEDIKQIEVIRGSSGVIWGANAVNGVINIITKDSNRTTGTYISLGGGIEENGFASVRFGADNDTAAYRGYLMTEARDGGVYPLESKMPNTFLGGKDAPDSRRLRQGGFRLDWLMDDQTEIHFQGDIYDVQAGAFGSYVPRPFVDYTQPYISRDSYKGHNLVVKADKKLSGQSNLALQLFHDRYYMNTISYAERRDTYDVDLQYNGEKYNGNLLSIGGNYRSSFSIITDKPTLQMPDDGMDLMSMFINDDIDIIPDRLKLILGVKFEKSSYMAWQTQPHIRIIYNADHWSVWAAVSKAVRSPNMAEASVVANVASLPPNVLAPGAPGLVARGVGTGAVKPEVVRSYELGIRFHPSENLLMQFTAFHMNYRGISDFNSSTADRFLSAQGLVQPVYFKNVLDGKSEGVEADITFQVNDWAKIKGTYSFLHQSYRPVASLINDPTALDTVKSTTKQSPKYRYSLGLSLDPVEFWEFDMNVYGWSLYRNDGFGAHVHGVNRVVNSYNRLDMRIGWQFNDYINVSLAGQNLLKAAHREDVDSSLQFASLIQQSYYLKIDYNY